MRSTEGVRLRPFGSACCTASPVRGGRLHIYMNICRALLLLLLLYGRMANRNLDLQQQGGKDKQKRQDATELLYDSYYRDPAGKLDTDSPFFSEKLPQIELEHTKKKMGTSRRVCASARSTDIICAANRRQPIGEGRSPRLPRVVRGPRWRRYLRQENEAIT